MPQFVSLLYALVTVIVTLLYYIKNAFLVLFFLTVTSDGSFFSFFFKCYDTNT